jgi:hypothetical protein
MRIEKGVHGKADGSITARIVAKMPEVAWRIFIKHGAGGKAIWTA